MISKSTLLHLRIPFSYFLSPLFFLSLSLAKNADGCRAALLFVILHLFLYSASNAFNSYYDRDSGSIGGLRHPPPVEPDLLYVSLAFDLIALLLGFLIDWTVALALFIYGFMSKTYSHPKIRLKKRPIVSWLGVGIFQGAFIFLLVQYAVTAVPWRGLITVETLIPAALCSLYLWASYPMTQIYQHDEDRRHGDLTLSMMLGIRGTFIFTAVCFTLVTAGFASFFYFYHDAYRAALFALCLAPVAGYFLLWMKRVFHDTAEADFTSTMRLNLLSSTAMNVFCLLFYLMGK